MFGFNLLEVLFIAVIAAGIVGGVYLVFSKSPLADTFKSKAKAKEAELARKLDDANARILNAQTTNQGKLATANMGKVKSKAARNVIRKQYNDAVAERNKWDIAAQNAAMNNRPDLLEKALRRKSAAQALVTKLEPSYQQLEVAAQKVAESVAILEDQKAKLKVDEQVIKGRSIAADTTQSVNQTIAGLNVNGESDEVSRAYEILNEVEANADAWDEMAQEVKDEQALEAELVALANNTPSVDDEMARYMAEYGPKTES